jgi:hypothetical protein
MITAERGSGRTRMVRIQLRIDRLRRRGSPPRTGSASSALRGAHTRRGVIGDRELRVVLARTRARSDPHLRAQDRNGVASASGAGGAGGDQSLRYAARVIDVLRRVLRHEPDPRFGALEIERNRPNRLPVAVLDTVRCRACDPPSVAGRVDSQAARRNVLAISKSAIPYPRPPDAVADSTYGDGVGGTASRSLRDTRTEAGHVSTGSRPDPQGDRVRASSALKGEAGKVFDKNPITAEIVVARECVNRGSAGDRPFHRSAVSQSDTHACVVV